jgi:5-(carboxyamino)imidazole ribonucleotide synthase
VAERARVLGGEIADKLELVGLLAVEMFVKADGALLINDSPAAP